MTTSDQTSPSSRRPQLDRRGVFGIAAALAAVPTVALLPELSADAAPHARSGRLVLRPDHGAVTKALDIPVGHPSGRAMTNRPVTSAVMETTEFAALGVTWTSGSGDVQVRTRAVGGGWTAWRTLRGLHAQLSGQFAHRKAVEAVAVDDGQSHRPDAVGAQQRGARPGHVG